MLKVTAQDVLAFLIHWYLKNQSLFFDLLVIQEVNGHKMIDSKKTFWKTIVRQLFIRPQRNNFMGRILDKTENTEHTLNKVSTQPLISLF